MLDIVKPLEWTTDDQFGKGFFEEAVEAGPFGEVDDEMKVDSDDGDRVEKLCVAFMVEGRPNFVVVTAVELGTRPLGSDEGGPVLAA